MFIPFIQSKHPFFFEIFLHSPFRYEEQIISFVRELFKSYEFPSVDCKLTDFYPDLSSSSSTSSRFVSVRSWLKSRVTRSSPIRFSPIDTFAIGERPPDFRQYTPWTFANTLPGLSPIHSLDFRQLANVHCAFVGVTYLQI
jgi:hypothetical protein